MNKLLKYLAFFSIYLLACPAFAVKFNHFELKGSLKEVQAQVNSQSHFRNNKSTIQTETKVPLIEDLIKALSGNYNNIGKEQTDRLLENYDLGGGVLNFSGFTWYKPMLNYDIKVDRSLAPHFNSDIWIVRDKFHIFIEAASLLTNLKENELIEVSDETIGAFAGITFKRTYQYTHFATSYLEGLTSDYSKLFMSFAKYNPKGILTIGKNHILKKTDIFTFNAGGVIDTPLGNGTSISAGVLTNIAKKVETQIQNVEEDSSNSGDEVLRITIDKQVNKSAQANLSYQTDFFNLLKISLLSFSFEYSYGETNSTALTFYQQDKEEILSNSPAAKEFKSILKANDDIHFWKKNIVSSEQRLKENYSSNFSFLLFGTMKKRATEQIKIIKNDIEKVFFSHYSESIKYIQSLLSRLFQKAIQKIFDFELSVTNKAELKKKLKIEYEHLKEIGPASVENEGQFSLQFNYFFHIAKTHKWYHRSYQRSAVRYAKNITKLKSSIINKLQRKELRGPLTINSSIEINRSALEFLNQLSEEEAIQSFLNVCKVRSRKFTYFFDPKLRKKYFKEQLRGSDYCAKKMITRYTDYIEKFLNYNVIDLMKLKKFIGYYFSKSKGLSDIEALFGENNIFIHGDFRAKTKSGSNFQTYFKAGQFKSLGVIDEFKNSELITTISTNNE